MENEKRTHAEMFAAQLKALAAKDPCRYFSAPGFTSDETSADSSVEASDRLGNGASTYSDGPHSDLEEPKPSAEPSYVKNVSPLERDAPSSTSAHEELQSQVSEPTRAAFEKRKARADRLGSKMGRLTELSQRAKGGDRAAVEEIQLILDADEDLWQSLGDAGAATDSVLFEALSFSMPAVQESVRRQVESMKQSLLSSEPSEIERMSVQRVTQCWLFMQLLDRSCVNAIQQNARPNELGKLQESAEKRYHTALRNLKFIKQYYNSKVGSLSDSGMPVISTDGDMGQSDHSADASHSGQTERQKNSAIGKEEVKVGELQVPRIAIAS